MSITTPAIRTFVTTRLPAKASPGEINRELACLKRMFTLAGQLQAAHSHAPRGQRPARVSSSPSSSQRSKRKLPAPLQPVVTFAYLTGWRLTSEILPLEWRQVDWQGRTVRLDPGTTKNTEGRTFPFTAALEAVLKGQKAEHEELKKANRIVPLVFHRDGERIKSLRGAWQAACKAAGVPGRILHDFRRTAVRNIERDGVSVRQRWRWSVTRPRRSIGDMRSSTPARLRMPP